MKNFRSFKNSKRCIRFNSLKEVFFVACAEAAAGVIKLAENTRADKKVQQIQKARRVK